MFLHNICFFFTAMEYGNESSKMDDSRSIFLFSKIANMDRSILLLYVLCNEFALFFKAIHEQ